MSRTRSRSNWVISRARRGHARHWRAHHRSGAARVSGGGTRVAQREGGNGRSRPSDGISSRSLLSVKSELTNQVVGRTAMTKPWIGRPGRQAGSAIQVRGWAEGRRRQRSDVEGLEHIGPGRDAEHLHVERHIAESSACVREPRGWRASPHRSIDPDRADLRLRGAPVAWRPEASRRNTTRGLAGRAGPAAAVAGSVALSISPISSVRISRSLLRAANGSESRCDEKIDK